MLEGIEYPSGRNGYPDPVTLFGLGNAGQTWTSPYVVAKLVSNNNTITTPSGTYRNAVRYDLTFGSSVQTWYLVPGTGFVQFGAGTGLALSKVTLNVPPASPAPTSGTCPNVGITANPPANGNFSTTGLEAALQTAIGAGSNFMTIETSWSTLEPSPGTYDLSSISSQIAWAAKYKQNAVLLIKTIDTMSRAVPSDLYNLSWNDALMISRWQGLLKAVLPALNSNIKWIELGNEVNTYLTAYPAEISTYSAFIQSGQGIITAIKPSISTGVVYAFDSWHLNDTVFRTLNPLMQHVAFTYYDANAAVATAVQRSPADIPFDFADMVAAAASKPLILTEVGYASSTAINSSPATQQSFYATMLTTFAGASGKLTGATFSFMSDFPASTLNALATEYGASGASWVSWIGSLGLFDSSGNPKPAWTTFQAQAVPMQKNSGCTVNSSL